MGTSDSRFRAENVRLDCELTVARVPHLFRLDSGGHSQNRRQRTAAAWLRLAVERLARPTTG